MKYWFLVGVVVPAMAAATDRWNFVSRQALTPEPVVGVFHHLEGSGRKHIAVSGSRVAVVWEDNRTGAPQIYLAIGDTDSFPAARQVSNGEEAWEPAIAALGEGVFALVWEQDGGVFVEIDSPQRQPLTVRLAQGRAGQASVASTGNRVFVTWREQRQQGWHVMLARLEYVADGRLRLLDAAPVESKAVPKPVLFPSVIAAGDAVFVAWEDRRAGHTRLMSSLDSGQGFAAPAYLNEFSSNRNEYDKGNGVTRLSLALVGEDEVLAAWMDKRRSNVGYGIWAGLGSGLGAMFGPNEKVHGANGDLSPHNNPAVTGNADGDFVVVWDDFRTGDSDIWLSSYTDDAEWSADHAPEVASGVAEQSHPSVALDEEGNLHLVWLERDDPDAPTRLWYSVGRKRTAQ